MKKKLSSLVLLLALAGCDVSVSPDLSDIGTKIGTVPAFEGVIDGVTYDVNNNIYVCNAADNFIYRISDNTAVLNADSTQATCNTALFTRVDTVEAINPIYN